MLTKLGHKYKQAHGWVGNKVKDVRRQGAKIVNNPGVRAAAVVGAAVVGAVANNKINNAKESRNERVVRNRVEAERSTVRHNAAMKSMDPTGSKQKGLDTFVASKPFESAFNFDEPF